MPILPSFQSQGDTPFQMLQSKWASIINPVLSLPTNAPSFLKDLSVVSGSNVINHRLGRTPQGWIIIDTNAAITLYRSAAFNDLTLTLTSSGSGVISLMVF